MKKLLRLISVATMLLAATTFMACSSDDDDDDSGARSVSARTSGSVVGVVLDNKGEPVEGATVTLGGKTAKTNYGGEFEITGVNPNDSKLIKAAKTVTTTSTESTTPNATTGATATSHSTTSTAGDGSVSTDVIDTSATPARTTGYTLTVKKDGYLPGKITGIYVTYQDTEDPEVTRANALLHGLQFDYQDVLDKYADALKTANNYGATVGTTATTTTTATEDTTATTTVQTGSNADRVFKDISEAISALKSLYKTGSYTEYFSDFGTTSKALIPLDATFKGSLKLNLTSKTDNTKTIAEKTYTPTSKPKIHVSYKSTEADKADYTWETTADENGLFELNNLPSGVALTISVDSFQETIESNAYWFSSDSMIIDVENSGAETNGTVSTVTLGSKDVNHETFRFLLFAQNEKLWVTATNVEPTTSGVLLTKKDALTFTFNKPMTKVEIAEVVATNGTAVINNLTKDAYTASLSEDKKTVTFTPNIGYWILANTNTPKVKLTALATDGTSTLINAEFEVYFDNKVWVSVKDLSYADYNDYRALSAPIVLEFSKPMNEKIAVELENNKTAYTEAWNDTFTELTLTPDAKVGYWDIGSANHIKVRVIKDFANSKDTYIDEFGYWKVGAVAATTGNNAVKAHIAVYFDNYNDVTLEKVSDSEFTVTFAKALKALTDAELDKNVKVYKFDDYTKLATFTGATKVADRKVSLNADGTVLTIKAQNVDFEKYGYYAIDFGKDVFVAKTGESILRKASTVDSVELDANNKTEGTLAKTPFVTTFTLGSEFKYVSVAIVDSNDEDLAKAKASRAVYEENDKYVKLEFNKDVKTSDIAIYGGTTGSGTTEVVDNGKKATPTNWINGKYVFLSLKGAKDDWKVILKGTVKSTSGADWKLGAENAGFDTLYVVSEKFFKMESSSLYAQKPSIAGGENDVKTQKVIPVVGNTFTFSFDQDVSKATWTAELYDEANVGKKDLEKTVYAVDVAADNDTVTVTVNKDKKQLDFSKKYYLSLKATNGVAGEEAFVYYDSSKTELDKKYYKVVDTTTTANNTLGDKITVADVNGNRRYIWFETVSKDYQLENLYVLAAHNGYDNTKTSKTTSFDEFSKSIQSDIVLEFNSDISEIIKPANVYLVNEENYTPAQGKTAASGLLKKDDLDNKKTYASTATVVGNVLTVKPTYAFPSKSSVYVVVFDNNGDRIYLKDVAGSQYFSKAYVSAIVYQAAVGTTTPAVDNRDKVLNEAVASTATELKLAAWTTDKKERPIANGQTVVFTFDPVVAAKDQDTSTVKYGKYTLYQKKQILPSTASKWELLGEYDVGNADDAKAVKYVKRTDTTVGTKTTTKYTFPKATVEDLSILKKQACVEAKLAADEFNYIKKAEFRLVCTIDNVEIYSKTLEVEANSVVLAAAVDLTGLSNIPADLGTEANLADGAEKTLTVKVGSYLKTVNNVVKGDKGEGTLATRSANSVTNNKVTAKLDEDADGKTIKVTIPNNTTACKGDKLTITVEDVVGTPGTIEIVLSN